MSVSVLVLDLALPWNQRKSVPIILNLFWSTLMIVVAHPRIMYSQFDLSISCSAISFYGDSHVEIHCSVQVWVLVHTWNRVREVWVWVHHSWSLLRQCCWDDWFVTYEILVCGNWVFCCVRFFFLDFSILAETMPFRGRFLF